MKKIRTEDRRQNDRRSGRAVSLYAKDRRIGERRVIWLLDHLADYIPAYYYNAGRIDHALN